MPMLSEIKCHSTLMLSEITVNAIVYPGEGLLGHGSKALELSPQELSVPFCCHPPTAGDFLFVSFSIPSENCPF